MIFVEQLQDFRKNQALLDMLYEFAIPKQCVPTQISLA